MLVTGATGFVEGRLVRALVAAGHDVTAVVRAPGKASELATLGVRVQRGDVTDKEGMRAPMTGVDGLFHVAGWYRIGGRNRSQGRAVNVDGTRNVLELKGSATSKWAAAFVRSYSVMYRRSGRYVSSTTFPRVSPNTAKVLVYTPFGTPSSA